MNPGRPRFATCAALVLGLGLAVPARSRNPIGPRGGRSPQAYPEAVMSKSTETLVIAGVRYEIVRRSTGTFRAVDEKSGAELWAVDLEGSSKDVSAVSMRSEPGGTILVEDECRRLHRVDPAKRTSRIAAWPVGLREISPDPLKVEVLLTNSLDRAVSFDKPSVAYGGRLENDLFEVKADGKAVPYGGMMKKRARPESFLVLKPRESYSAIVDLASGYAIARGAKSVEIRFAQQNHFSKDDFELVSGPLTIRLSPP